MRGKNFLFTRQVLHHDSTEFVSTATKCSCNPAGTIVVGMLGNGLYGMVVLKLSKANVCIYTLACLF